MKKKLACGCEVDWEEIKKKPLVECPKCKNKVFDTRFCTACGNKLKED